MHRPLASSGSVLQFKSSEVSRTKQRRRKSSFRYYLRLALHLELKYTWKYCDHNNHKNARERHCSLEVAAKSHSGHLYQFTACQKSAYCRGRLQNNAVGEGGYKQLSSDHRDGHKKCRESCVLWPAEGTAVAEHQILQRHLCDMAKHGIRTRDFYRHTVPCDRNVKLDRVCLRYVGEVSEHISCHSVAEQQIATKP